MEKIKNLLSVVKDSILLVLFLLLLFFPGMLNSILERAGFTEGSIMGFTWKEKALQSKEVADSSQQIANQATLQVEQMQVQLDNLSRKLSTLSTPANNSQVSEMVASLDSSKKRASKYNLELRKNLVQQSVKLNNIFKK
jgi:hypothetical protein